MINMRYWILPVGVLTLFGAGLARAEFVDSHGDAIDVVVKQQDDSQHTVWRIDQPNVAQLATVYPQIQFLPGDTIRVLAGGCDQTGGFGRTWKRYVNPQGSDSDKLYHGLILIPEALPEPPHDPGLAKSLYNQYSRLSDFGVGDGMGNGVGVERHIPDRPIIGTSRRIRFFSASASRIMATAITATIPAIRETTISASTSRRPS
jgi:hypothetical protein